MMYKKEKNWNLWLKIKMPKCIRCGTKISIDIYEDNNDCCFKCDNGRIGCFPKRLPNHKLICNDLI
jgi:hypothetical protein